MLRRPPRSTLFPYTTPSDLPVRDGRADDRPASWLAADHQLPARTRDDRRSEEHTSELQSHSDLVCRLLLEKKKKKTTRDGHCTAPRRDSRPEIRCYQTIDRT